MNWYKKICLSSDADSYFEIGHGDYSEDYDFEPDFQVWVHNGGRDILTSDIISKDPETGMESAPATHGFLWGHDFCDKHFKGRYEHETGRLSIVVPCDDIRYYDSFEDLPTNLKQGLLNKFNNIKKVLIFN